MRFALRLAACLLFVLYVLPIALSAALYYFKGSRVDWRSADRSSARLIPAVGAHPPALVRILSARTVRWRGIVATHSWVVIKDAGAMAYERFDYTAWGTPIWKDRFVPDGQWFGSQPEVVFAADGARAQQMIPFIRKTIQDYRYRQPGDYKAWPGPNSNTFIAAIMQSVPGMTASLPPTAVGKDFPYNGRWFGTTPSNTGLRINLGGFAGLTVGWYEGVEVNLLGAVAGVDLRRPALKLPGLGRIGMAAFPQPSMSSQHLMAGSSS